MAKSIIGCVGEFSDREDSWQFYIDRLEQFFVANDVDNEGKKKAILLSSVGAKTYKLLTSLSQPKSPKDLSYSQIVTLIKNHQNPEPSSIVQRFKFNSRVRKPEESVRNYVAELRKLSEFCDFGDNLDDMLRDRLVCGINDRRIQTKLLSERNLTFDKALEISQATEAAVQNFESLTKPAVSAETVHFLKKKSKYSGNKVQKSCFRCGNKHDPNKCKYKDATCYACSRVGHPSFNCRSKKPSKNHKGGDNHSNQVNNQNNRHFNLTDEDVSIELNDLFTISTISSNKPLVTELFINEKSINFQIDTGASLTVMSRKIFEDHFDIPLAKTDKTLKTYTGESVNIIGEVQVNVRTGNDLQCKVLPLLILEGNGPALLGRNWLEDVKIDWSVFFINTPISDSQSCLQETLNEFSDVFSDNPGCLKGVKVKFNVDPTATPKFIKARQPPYALRSSIEDELARLQRDGIIQPVEFSNWATPIVPIVKSDHTIRICGDYKSTLNKVTTSDSHPIPRIEDMANALAPGQKFTKLDFSHAYTQLQLHDDSKELTTVNTHRGLFQYQRLNFGMSAAPGIFQRHLEQLFQGVPLAKNYIDDLYVTGRDDSDHLQNLRNVFQICREKGLTLRKSKCDFMKDEVYFLGFRLNKHGLRPVEGKVKAVRELPPPVDKRTLKSFLGSVNYYCQFVPNLATILAPLYRLLRNNVKWVWGEIENKAFSWAKSVLSSDTVLTHFDPNQKTIITCDASPVGVGAILSQVDKSGIEKPVAYASRSLSAAERKYAQIDREALAIIFSVKKWHKYIFGRHVSIATDHKPLLGLFGEDKALPEHTSARVQRWAVILSAYSYELKHISGSQNDADVLSRLPLSSVKDEIPDIDTETPLEIHELFNLIDKTPLNVFDIASETQNDPLLRVVLKNVLSGWSDECTKDESLKSFYVRRHELSCERGCILWGVRIIIPSSLRQNILDILHDTHIGMARMKAQARSWVWWPKLDADIERMVRSCYTCQLHSTKPQKAPLFPWDWPDEPWHRVHLDFAGPFLGKQFLLITDAHSKWIDVRPMSKITASATILELREVFATLGLCAQIVTDNGPTFTSSEFRNFLTHNGIKHITVSPYHPSSNGLAERSVQTFKKAMAKNNVGSIQERICKFLTKYRSLPHSTTGLSPSELLFGRKMRTHLDLIHPNLISRVNKCQQRQKNVHDRHSSEREISVGDQVFVENFSGRGEKWVSGLVIEKTGPYSFKIKTPVGIMRRHIDQIRLDSTDEFIPIDTPNNVIPDLTDTTPREELSSQVRTSDGSALVSQSNPHDVNVPNDITTDIHDNIVDMNLPSDASTNINESIRSECCTNESVVNVPVRRSSRQVKTPDRLDL